MNDETNVRLASHGLDWLLDGLVDRVPGAENAIALSTDGLPLAASRALDREQTEHLAAMASALYSLGRGVGTRFGKGTLQQTVIELDHGYLVVTSAGFGTCLALLADLSADLGMIAYEMNVIVGQVRDQLSTGSRVPSVGNSHRTQNLP